MIVLGGLHVWDFSSDIPRKDADLPTLIYQRSDPHNWKCGPWIQISTTVLGQLLCVDLLTDYRTWHFRIYEFNPVTGICVQIDSLGDEAIILDLGFTVVAKDIPGIKKNSIYFSGVYHPLGDLTLKDPDYIYMFMISPPKPWNHNAFSSLSSTLMLDGSFRISLVK
ncbi:putative F-box protein [Cardamine amara subsp. amara]|uniref:F-box protein n=1 Tax=Cardamine amara subsp. amara TaxID=228776 RepID=A0ABD1A1A4_CARAN